jgi:D-glycero-alpha-D-manno-heptose-7-phosphate kinase
MRISLGGGGTDLPSYYEKFGGFLMSAAIDKYVYVMVHQCWSDEYIIKYSQLERVAQIADIRHPIVRSALDMLQIGPNIEVCSMADIPAGTGLGSSGAFTTSLLKALHAYKKNLLVSPHELAEQACHIEIDLLKEPIGKQDQFISAYGGITVFDIASDGRVHARPAKMTPSALYTLEDSLAIFFTGFSRSASNLLKDQDQRSKQSEAGILKNLHYIKDLGYRIRETLEGGDLRAFGELMHEHWEHKRARSQGMSNSRIDELYELGRKNGAIGGKLIGAGGGGFLLFYTESKRQLREAMEQAGVEELRFRFDFEGTKIINQGA